MVEVAGFTLTRATHRTIAYLLHQLRPQPQLEVTVERGGARRTLTLLSRFRKLRRRLDLDNELDRTWSDAVACSQEAASDDDDGTRGSRLAKRALLAHAATSCLDAFA